MKLSEISRKGMYIATYYENGFQVIKMCTKKQFLRELEGLDGKVITRICNNAVFTPLH